nr:PREDICTED: fas-binding factor 1 [Apteryx mantelli mantelli]
MLRPWRQDAADRAGAVATGRRAQKRRASCKIQERFKSLSPQAAKSRKGLRDSIDDVLGDLLGYDDETPVKSARASQPAGGSGGRARGTSSLASKKSFLEDDFFSKLPAEDIEAAEGSDVSDADPQAVLQTLKDMDDMEADLLGISKPSSGPGKMTAKGPEKCDPTGGAVKTAEKLLTPEKGESAPAMEKKPLSSPPASRQYKKFNFEDLDDPLAGLLSDEEQNAPKKPTPSGTENSSAKKLELSKEKGESAPAMEKKPLSSPPASRQYKKFNFEDLDDPLAGLLSDEEQNAPKKPTPSGTENSSAKKLELSKEKELPAPQLSQHAAAPVRRREELTFEDDGDDLMDALGFGDSPKGDPKQGRKGDKDELRPARSKLDELLGWGSAAKALERPGTGERREFKLDTKYQKQPEKEEPGDEEDFVFGAYQPTVASSPAQASAAGSCPSPTVAGQPDPTSQLPAAEEPAAKPDPPEEDNWLSAALSRKKAQAQAKAQERGAEPSETPGKGLDPRSATSQPAAPAGAPPQAAAPQGTAASEDGSGHPVPRLSAPKKASALPPESRKEDPAGDASALAPAALFPGQQEMPGPAPLAQAAVPRTHLPAAPQPQVEPLALGSLHMKGPGAPAAQFSEDGAGYQAALLSAQARVAKLESQVRTLELERMQQKLLLESLQQRHQEDLDLLESAHRYGVLSSPPSPSLSSVLQDRLSQQQRDMEEERSRLQEIIAKMEARLGEQTRLLEQERWRATAEQSKVESLQRSLEEQRRVMTQQLSMERAELERAKSALLEEQKSVMQKCSEERRKLSAEWAEFHTQQQLSKERLERDMDRALQRDSQREGTIMSLAKEQAELKIRASELKAKEEQLARDRELLDQAWQELRLEKEKVNGAALHIRQRVEEIDTMSKLSAQKCEEGERALREARRVESEHQARLRVMQQNLEQLKQQEQHLHQERLSMALQRRQLQQLREELPNNPTLLLTTAQDISTPAKGLSSTLSFPRRNPGGSRDSPGTAGPSELYAKLLLLKHRAQQDRDFLEDEQFFLETLKKASYNTSSLSA